MQLALFHKKRICYKTTFFVNFRLILSINSAVDFYEGYANSKLYSIIGKTK